MVARGGPLSAHAGRPALCTARQAARHSQRELRSGESRNAQAHGGPEWWRHHSPGAGSYGYAPIAGKAHPPFSVALADTGNKPRDLPALRQGKLARGAPRNHRGMPAAGTPGKPQSHQFGTGLGFYSGKGMVSFMKIKHRHELQIWRMTRGF